MKKVLLSAMLLLMLAGVLSAAPVLFEAYQEGWISIPMDKEDTLSVVEVSFSVDSACHVMLTAGGQAKIASLWLEMDENRLPPQTNVQTDGFGGPVSFTMVYSYLLDPGEHAVSLRLAHHYIAHNYTATCRDAYLQALIFLPDTSTNAVAEPPMSDNEPRGNTPSLISSGPYVNVAGATELVDASGRVIEGAISDDRVYISNLPTGTYFARNGEHTVVKIVKVE
ncbi:hypothetical protein CEE36_09635 [candidate division TA06 bacterium B3_TA06]|uniref:Secretion system C-terminal sorting domain-containing protein n=1 Tax=candidate division TA06 bacterium B3_TA06 TaxID=2012487 RepID=A0A532UZ24_UNCT6|nr:MAG: hypothetical protein CEE36_09635 [candidate division TA06 bacterium B3_TA06]